MWPGLIVTYKYYLPVSEEPLVSLHEGNLPDTFNSLETELGEGLKSWEVEGNPTVF